MLVLSEVRVEGLETLDYLDNLQNKERFTEQGDALTFESEVSIDLSFETSVCVHDSKVTNTVAFHKKRKKESYRFNSPFCFLRVTGGQSIC